MEDTIKLDELEDALDVYCLYKSMMATSRAEKSLVYSGWELNFGSFYKWAKENGFEKGKIIEKKSRTAGYVPENIKIMFPKKSITGSTSHDRVYIKYGEEIRSATDWSRILRTPRTTIYDRIQRGWTDEEVIEGRRKRGKNGNN